MKILKIDDSIIGNMSPDAITAYYNNTDSYSIVNFRACANPYMAWAFPVMTGKKYKLHWASGLDFMYFEMDLSPKWSPTDLDVNFVFNFTDLRA